MNDDNNNLNDSSDDLRSFDFSKQNDQLQSGLNQEYPQPQQQPNPDTAYQQSQNDFQQQAYQQPQDGFQQQAYQQPMQPGQGGPQRPYGKSRAPRVIAIIAVIVIALAAMAVVFGKDMINKILPSSITKIFSSPQERLDNAFTLTSENIKKQSIVLPDFEKFKDVPTEHKLSLGIEYLDEEMFGYDASMFEGSTIDLLCKYDKESQKMLANLSFDINGIAFNNNEIFISKDKIALSVPDIYDGDKYITVNPATLADDWNSSDFAQYIGDFPDMEDMTIIDIIGFLFGEFGEYEDLVNGLNIDTEAFMQELETIAQATKENAVYTDGGSVETKVGGKTVKLDKISYTVSADDMTDCYVQILDIYRDILMDFMSGFESYLGYNGFDDMEYIFEDAKNIEFVEDLVYNFYFNNDQIINKIEIENMVISAEDVSEELKMNVIIDMYGEDNPIDKMDLEMEMEADDEKVVLNFNRDANATKDSISDSVRLSVKADREKVFDASYTFDWDKKSSDMKLSLAMSAPTSGEEGFSIDISGKLSDSGSVVEFADGVISASAGEYEVLELNLGYSIAKADAASIAYDEDDSRDFFDFNMMEFAEIFSSMSGY